MADKLLICMMGLPRSGKSTKAHELSKKLNAPVVNRDSIRLALHGQRFVQCAEPMVKAMSGIMVDALFRAGHDMIIVDETNITRSTRDFWRGIQPNIKFLHVRTSKDECIRRARSTNDSIIQPVIERMALIFEPLEDDEIKYEE